MKKNNAKVNWKDIDDVVFVPKKKNSVISKILLLFCAVCIFAVGYLFFYPNKILLDANPRLWDEITFNSGAIVDDYGNSYTKGTIIARPGSKFTPRWPVTGPWPDCLEIGSGDTYQCVKYWYDINDSSITLNGVKINYNNTYHVPADSYLVYFKSPNEQFRFIKNATAIKSIDNTNRQTKDRDYVTHERITSPEYLRNMGLRQ